MNDNNNPIVHSSITEPQSSAPLYSDRPLIFTIYINPLRQAITNLDDTLSKYILKNVSRFDIYSMFNPPVISRRYIDNYLKDRFRTDIDNTLNLSELLEQTHNVLPKVGKDVIIDKLKLEYPGLNKAVYTEMYNKINKEYDQTSNNRNQIYNIVNADYFYNFKDAHPYYTNKIRDKFKLMDISTPSIYITSIHIREYENNYKLIYPIESESDTELNLIDVDNFKHIQDILIEIFKNTYNYNYNIADMDIVNTIKTLKDKDKDESSFDSNIHISGNKIIQINLTSLIKIIRTMLDDKNNNIIFNIIDGGASRIDNDCKHTFATSDEFNHSNNKKCLDIPHLKFSDFMKNRSFDGHKNNFLINDKISYTGGKSNRKTRKLMSKKHKKNKHAKRTTLIRKKYTRNNFNVYYPG
jgi:hypothetical protein